MSVIQAVREAFRSMGEYLYLPTEEEVVSNLYLPISFVWGSGDSQISFGFEIPHDFIQVFAGKWVNIEECVDSCTHSKNFTSFTPKCYETPNKTYIEFFCKGEWVSFTAKSSSKYMASPGRYGSSD